MAVYFNFKSFVIALVTGYALFNVKTKIIMNKVAPNLRIYISLLSQS